MESLCQQNNRTHAICTDVPSKQQAFKQACMHGQACFHVPYTAKHAFMHHHAWPCTHVCMLMPSTHACKETSTCQACTSKQPCNEQSATCTDTSAISCRQTSMQRSAQPSMHATTCNTCTHMQDYIGCREHAICDHASKQT